jgi:hypothetical protein
LVKTFTAFSNCSTNLAPRLRWWSTASGALWKVLAKGHNASEATKPSANDVRMTIRRRLMYRMPLAGLTEFAEPVFQGWPLVNGK